MKVAIKDLTNRSIFKYEGLLWIKTDFSVHVHSSFSTNFRYLGLKDVGMIKTVRCYPRLRGRFVNEFHKNFNEATIVEQYRERYIPETNYTEIVPWWTGT